jgi:hypothetical protein
MKKWANELNKTFSRDVIQMTQKHMKKCSTSPAIKEMHIKTMLRFYLTSSSITTSRDIPK